MENKGYISTKIKTIGNTSTKEVSGHNQPEIALYDILDGEYIYDY